MKPLADPRTKFGPAKRFEHDCDRCVYLGTEKYERALFPDNAPMISSEAEADLYLCPSSADERLDTLIARIGSEGHDYCSCDVNMLRMRAADIASKHAGRAGQSTDGPALMRALYLYEEWRIYRTETFHQTRKAALER